MSKIDWRTAFTAGLTLILAFAIAGYFFGHQLGQEVGEKNAHTKEYERHAADEIKRTCLSRDPVAESECVVRVINTAHEHKRAESDLIAQRNMARWAFLMLLATVAMTFVTVGGVYYVWRTLNVTRDIGQAQVRAYISAGNGGIWESEILEICLTIQNSGASPAINAHIMVELEFWHDEREFPKGKSYAVGHKYTSPVRLGDIAANDDLILDNTGFFAFLSDSTNINTFEIKSATVGIFGWDVFGGEIEYIAGIGVFQNRADLNSKKGIRQYTTPNHLIDGSDRIRTVWKGTAQYGENQR